MPETYLVDPENRLTEIDSAHEAAALKAGFRLPSATELVAPNNEVRDVGEHVEEALSAGFRYVPGRAPEKFLKGPPAPPGRLLDAESTPTAYPAPPPDLQLRDLMSGRVEAPTTQQDIEDQTPEGQARIASQKAEQKHFETQTPLALVQGATRFLGGDFVREGLNRLEEGAQDYFGVKPENRIDLFQDRATVLKNREYNPKAAALGELASVVVPALLTGGTLGAAKGALVGKAVSVAPQLAKPAVAVVAPAVLEGAGWAAANRVNEQFLNEEYDDLGEKTLAGLAWEVAKDAAVGAAFGVAASGIGTAIRGAKKAYDKGKTLNMSSVSPPARHATMLPPPVEGAPDGPGRIYKIGRMVRGVLSSADDAPRTSLRPPPGEVAHDLELIGTKDTGRSGVAFRAGHALRKALINVDEAAAIKQDLHREIRTRLTKAVRLAEEVNGDAGIAAKSTHLQMAYPEALKSMPFRTGSEAVYNFRRDVGLLDDDLDVLFKNGASAGKGGRSTVKVLQEQLTAVEDNYFGEVDIPTTGTIYTVLDQQKRLLGSAAETAKNKYVQLALRSRYEKIRLVLEDESIWGQRLATEQKKVNLAWAENISQGRHEALKRVYIEGAETNPADYFLKLRVPNDAALNGLLNGVGRAEHETMEAAFKAHLDAAVADISLRAETWGSDTLRQKAAELADLVGEVQHGLSTAKLLNAYTAGKGAGKELSLAAGVGGAGGFGALAIHNPQAAFAAAGAAVGALGAKKAFGALQRNRTRSWFPSIDAAIKTQTTTENVARKVRLLGEAVEAPPLERAVRKALEVGPLNQWLQELYNDEDGGGPHSLLKQVQEDTPELLESVVAGMQRQRDFLSAKLGTVPQDRALRYVEAVRDPNGVLENIEDIKPEHLEALAAVYPGMHREVLASVEATLEPMTYQTQLILRSKFGLSPAPGKKLATLQALAGSQPSIDQQKQVLTPGNRRTPRLSDISA